MNRRSGIGARCCIAVVLTLISAIDVATRRQDVVFDVNDVSFLWPVPNTPDDVRRLLAADDLLADGKSPLWPRRAFDDLIKVAQTVEVKGSTGQLHRITFGRHAAEFASPATWRVSAVRVDPCAPGCDHDLAKEFGASPQIRLIFQPVTVTNNLAKVHDVTAHLVFSFTKGQDRPFVPDRDAFGAVVEDLKELKMLAQKQGVSTVGPLSVHPALRGPKGSEFAEHLKAVLRRRLTEQHLLAAAFMGLAPEPEPWVFFALARDASGRFVPSPHPALNRERAQMLIVGGDRVAPVPTPTNVTRRSETTPGRGVSTSLLFARGVEGRLSQPVFTDSKTPILSDVPDYIANPQLSNFFTTDCISCHSESARRRTLKIGPSSFRFSRPAGTSGVDPAVLPQDDWNVRNFGWFPSFLDGRTVPTATERTANEAAESAHAINRTPPKQ